jgi:CRISPR system Cascade subunit CasE
VYLSRLILNARHRDVRRDLADCHQLHLTVMGGFPDLSDGSDGQAAAGDARARLGVLFRLESHPRTGLVSVLVQSVAAPDWSRLPDGYLLETGGAPSNPDCKGLDAAFAAIGTGDELLFRLRANPTKRLPPATGTDGIRRDGKRVELRTEDEQVRWLGEKGVGNEERGRPGAGFRLVTVRARPGLAATGRPVEPVAVADARARSVGKLTGQALRSTGGGAARRERMTFGDVLFEGRLVVTDADVLRQTLVQGIGAGKAYGFGLLSVARAPV